MRVKIIKDHQEYKKGDTPEVTPNIAHGLIDSGYAELTKDMAINDYKVKNGRTKMSKLRKSL